MASNYNTRPRATEVLVEGENFRVLRLARNSNRSGPRKSNFLTNRWGRDDLRHPVTKKSEERIFIEIIVKLVISAGHSSSRLSREASILKITSLPFGCIRRSDSPWRMRAGTVIFRQASGIESNAFKISSPCRIVLKSQFSGSFLYALMTSVSREIAAKSRDS